jgi:endonuclease/exonuclease/phosphatase family metal-dependent hydrolase
MVRVFVQVVCCVSIFIAVSALLVRPSSAQSGTNIVLYASEAPVKSGWNVVADSAAAGGSKLSNPNLGVAKLPAALASPTAYFEMSVNVESGRAYRLWIRSKAANNDWANDSVFVQFSGSVNSVGAPTFRIGTTEATTINLEDCSGCGISGWGWQDNGWGTGVMGPLVYFSTTGSQTIRVQAREDGLSIDQIVLSPSTYISSCPGALRNDTTILSKSGGTPPPPPSGGSNIVFWASDVAPAGVVGSNWSKVYDGSAAGQTALRSLDAGAPKLSQPLANPPNYFQMTFNAEAGVAYRLWLRAKAQNNSPYNDSVFVQFSGSVDASGSAVYRIGSTSATCVNLEEDAGRGLSDWGWQDNGWGPGVFGPLIYFQATGSQTIRVQAREDGISIDQVVLSPATYLNASPGALKNDTVILPSSFGGGTPPPAGNQPPQATISATPTSGSAPLSVNFTSNAFDNDGYIASYNWNFGDGHTSTTPNSSNTYFNAGTYSARLTVTDNAGATASVTKVITVAGAPTGSTTLKVLSWNGQFGKGTDDIYNPDRTATSIKNINPDLVAMCEIPSDLAPVLRDLVAQKTGRTWYYYHVPKYVGTTEGNLILSKYPFSSTSSKFLSYQRSVAQATVNVGGKNINFFATHLDAYTSSYRAVEVGELTAWAANFAETRIICGDFNAGPDTGEISGMYGQYYDSWQTAMGSGVASAYPDNPVQMHTRTRRGRIDYVWYSKSGSNLTLRSAQVPDSRDLSNTNVVVYMNTLDDRGVRPSDHNQMVATFDLN